jgi:DNA modification methylase
MVNETIVDINNKFRRRINTEWSFQESRSTEYFTHCYHRYPAKFLPQLVKKLIENYTQPNDKIADIFAGCGTTLVEGKIHGRKSIGIDINPVAQLITRAKTTAIKPIIIEEVYKELCESIANYRSDCNYYNKTNERIEYWFEEKNRNKIAFLYKIIKNIGDDSCRDFFLCALSNILKNCSFWLQSSTKAQIDKNKIPADVFSSFKIQIKRMLKRNNEFYSYLESKKLLSTKTEIRIADARKTGLRTKSINAIIASPPYVTSYEYADIHQLTSYWFEYISDLTEFRKKFIGTFYSCNKSTEVKSTIAQKIVNKLCKTEIKIAGEVANYFNDMYDVALEIERILKPNGVVCLVIGNTSLRGVKIKSAEAFSEMLALTGLKVEEVIKRTIPVKLIPTIRDNKTGRFAKLSNKNSKKVYPNEFIIIARKQNVHN